MGRDASFYFQVKLDEHLVQHVGVGKSWASCGLCGIKQL